jgi:hypothetical protein
LCRNRNLAFHSNDQIRKKFKSKEEEEDEEEEEICEEGKEIKNGKFLFEILGLDTSISIATVLNKALCPARCIVHSTYNSHQ